MAFFRFYGELNDFLPPGQRQKTFPHTFGGNPAVKDMVESLGIPHTEIDLLLINGISVDFSRQVREGDRISVYPVFESIDISPLLKVRPEPLRVARFVLDTHLGKLASYLRMLGFDTLYQNDYTDDTLAHISAQEHRLLLTRDRGLLKRRQVTHGYYVRNTDPNAQVVEVLQRFDLFSSIKPFQRCLHCNKTLRPVEKQVIEDRLPPKVREHYDRFHTCDDCRRIYWEGTHYEKMNEFINNIRREENPLEGKKRPFNQPAGNG
ncbi:MAG: twitching motility protein PilT [Candidatus Syntrophonatronum acetioxidans]|uniref:Twitching motility protein PilT n=1 Tax=Candidatus Syntrophonatronum acetioxidans TaxID=1795816 RepID=A0A424YDP9_9FIRM|nr:MAG: twitching motility protein PilT [Candidatus Syntrophonatronum acetioxidans]